MEIGYLSVSSRTTVLQETKPLIQDMHGPPACGYALALAFLVPNYGSNSFTVLWRDRESQRLWKKIQTENPCRWAISNGKESSKGWITPTGNHLSYEFKGLSWGPVTLTCQTKLQQKPLPDNKMMEEGLTPYRILKVWRVNSPPR